MSDRKKITVVLVDRANYGRMRPLMHELDSLPDVELQVVCTGTMLLDRFGKAVDVVRADGFHVDEELYIELEGSVPITMAKSMSLAIVETSSALQRLSPDLVVVIGDRYEALGVAISAVFQNLCLVHIQGGEITGSIDESTRHAITKLAHYHFPATKRAGQYVVAMGERKDTVFPLGCPSADVVREVSKNSLPRATVSSAGVGASIDLQKPFMLCLFHPVTTDFQSAEGQMEEVLNALSETGIQTILIWPNIDAGSDGVSQAIRRFRESNSEFPLRAFKNFAPAEYIPLLEKAVCAVGNSSSFVRDASFLGTPIVLVGDRQDGRERTQSVLRVEPDKSAIKVAVNQQLAHGRFPASELYGRQGVSKEIARRISKLEPYAQKKLAYTDES